MEGIFGPSLASSRIVHVRLSESRAQRQYRAPRSSCSSSARSRAASVNGPPPLHAQTPAAQPCPSSSVLLTAKPIKGVGAATIKNSCPAFLTALVVWYAAHPGGERGGCRRGDYRRTDSRAGGDAAFCDYGSSAVIQNPSSGILYSDDFSSYTSSAQLNSGDARTKGNFWFAPSGHDMGGMIPQGVSYDPARRRCATTGRRARTPRARRTSRPALARSRRRSRSAISRGGFPQHPSKTCGFDSRRKSRRASHTAIRAAVVVRTSSSSSCSIIRRRSAAQGCTSVTVPCDAAVDARVHGLQLAECSVRRARWIQHRRRFDLGRILSHVDDWD
jgi:hypothetical protein